ncbi:Uncharacterized protein FWK35_00016043 [Aphis craccivora]|uniref:Uncharacterized protein n=1 Tax=Aphis craccivora TaxID=307492 RepID=A0A6G0Y8Y5_APHCR|nr:Uncharacterized protein FWK35_00016043 [Aphis craccivora]
MDLDRFFFIFFRTADTLCSLCEVIVLEMGISGTLRDNHSKNAKICVSGFQTNNSIPNINEKCNQKGNVPVGYTITTGSYELSEIELVMKHLLHNTDTLFELSADNNTLKCSIPHSKTIF